MKKYKVNDWLLFGVFFIMIVIQGCTTVPVINTRIIRTPELTFNQTDSTPLSQKGLSIKINPIYSKNIFQYPQFRERLSFSGTEIMNRWNSKYKKLMATEVPYSGSRTIPLFPLPAFEVTITNNTKHVVKFSNATLMLEDSFGNLFDVLSKQDLSSYLQEAIRISGVPSDATIENRNELYAKQKNVKLIDNNFKLLPGRTTKGYLAFNTGKYSSGGFRSFILPQENLNVQLFELPIKVDKAANILETTSFSFVFDLNIHEKTVQDTTYRYEFKKSTEENTQSSVQSVSEKK